ncbi:MAG: type II secretion system F family protein [Phycisphaeraceae bacterium]|nr:type II secretion system F family protein [Phycisphaeraceae bacterium]
MKFVYEGFDTAGRRVKGDTEAAGAAEATDALRRQGIFATQVYEQERSSRPQGKVSRARRVVTLRELAHFYRQLSILVCTHTPLVQALEVVERQVQPGPWHDVLADVRRRVEEGESFSEAMAEYPNCFDAISRSMVAAGESGGMLDTMLKGLSTLTRQQMTLRKSVVGALTYPVVLISISLVVVVVMMMFVLPKFEELFETLQTPLPPTTAVLMAAGAFLREFWWIVFPLIFAGLGGLGYYLTSPAGRRRIDHAAVHAPKVGPIVQSFATARLVRLLGVLIQARIALLDALLLTRESMTNACYAGLLERAEQAVQRGQTLASVMADAQLIAPAVSEAIASGEKTGTMGEVLVQVADYLDEDNEQTVKALGSLIEPIILTVLGLVVGFVAISMFLPLFDLTAAGGAGPTP